ncbi:YggT family protein, partial [Oleiphilus sp. HI0117]
PINIVLLSAILVASFLIKIYFWSLIIMIVASWIAPGSGHPALLLINQITEPLMKPFRKILPAMGGLDLSPIFAFLTLQVLETVVSHLMRMI